MFFMTKTKRRTQAQDKNNDDKHQLVVYGVDRLKVYLVYLPQICNMNTLAMKIKLMTSTGTGPTFRPGESSV